MRIYYFRRIRGMKQSAIRLIAKLIIIRLKSFVCARVIVPSFFFSTRIAHYVDAK